MGEIVTVKYIKHVRPDSSAIAEYLVEEVDADTYRVFVRYGTGRRFYEHVFNLNELNNLYDAPSAGKFFASSYSVGSYDEQEIMFVRKQESVEAQEESVGDRKFVIHFNVVAKMDNEIYAKDANEALVKFNEWVAGVDLSGADHVKVVSIESFFND